MNGRNINNYNPASTTAQLKNTAVELVFSMLEQQRLTLETSVMILSHPGSITSLDDDLQRSTESDEWSTQIACIQYLLDMEYTDQHPLLITLSRSHWCMQLTLTTIQGLYDNLVELMQVVVNHYQKGKRSTDIQSDVQAMQKAFHQFEEVSQRVWFPQLKLILDNDVALETQDKRDVLDSISESRELLMLLLDGKADISASMLSDSADHDWLNFASDFSSTMINQFDRGSYAIH